MNFKFHENLSSGSRAVPCGRTDRQTDINKPTAAFRIFAKASKIQQKSQTDIIVILQTWRQESTKHIISFSSLKLQTKVSNGRPIATGMYVVTSNAPGLSQSVSSRNEYHKRTVVLTHWERMTQICVFNTRLFSLHNTLNYEIQRACLRMVLLTDVYRNPTSLWINL